VLHLVQPDLGMWIVILVASLAPLPIAQGAALVLRRRRSGAAP
jgi:hypothetical protein